VDTEQPTDDQQAEDGTLTSEATLDADADDNVIETQQVDEQVETVEEHQLTTNDEQQEDEEILGDVDNGEGLCQCRCCSFTPRLNLLAFTVAHVLPVRMIGKQLPWPIDLEQSANNLSPTVDRQFYQASP